VKVDKQRKHVSDVDIPSRECADEYLLTRELFGLEHVCTKETNQSAASYKYKILRLREEGDWAFTQVIMG
jgi:hypothetical protein